MSQLTRSLTRSSAPSCGRSHPARIHMHITYPHRPPPLPHPRSWKRGTVACTAPRCGFSTGGRDCRCGVRHDEQDPTLGTPLNPDTYDYEAPFSGTRTPVPCGGAAAIYLRREVAKRAGLTQREFRHHARVSFTKVAEYQKRGAVHFHAVIRLDGPEGGDTSPPDWATAELLTDAIRAAATAASIEGLEVDGRSPSFVFGRQLDARTIRSADFDDGQELIERAVAAYTSKYDGRLFANECGGVVASTTYWRVWDEARHLALTPEQVASPLAARPYDLRHAALSSWLNAGVDPTEVAERAGNSVEVLLSRYAKCLDGRQDIAIRRIAELLGEDDGREDEPGDGS
ncbi:replication initiator [Streptomyces purpurascens]|uniref:replication initiator n=1 Tax=Streptomyces purpurascens TaxID=1924 RepID=UPI003864BEF0